MAVAVSAVAAEVEVVVAVVMMVKVVVVVVIGVVVVLEAMLSVVAVDDVQREGSADALRNPYPARLISVTAEQRRQTLTFMVNHAEAS